MILLLERNNYDKGWTRRNLLISIHETFALARAIIYIVTLCFNRASLLIWLFNMGRTLDESINSKNTYTFWVVYEWISVIVTHPNVDQLINEDMFPFLPLLGSLKKINTIKELYEIWLKPESVIFKTRPQNLVHLMLYNRF